MSNDNRVEVEFGATTGGIEKGSNDAARAVEQAVEKMRAAMRGTEESVRGMHGGFADAMSGMREKAGALDGIMGKFLNLGTIVSTVIGTALVATIKESVNTSKELTGEANKLGAQLGMTTGEASVLAVALGDAYVSSDQYSAVVTGMSRNLRQNESAMNAMGLATRDANGNLRPTMDLIKDGAKLLGEYRAGMDQTIAAQQLFGRGATDVGAIMKIANVDTEAAREKAEALGLTITNNNVQALREYKAAMNDVGDVQTALRKTIGDVFMPILTKLGEWFASIGPAAVAVTRYAMGTLAAAFWTVKNGVVVLWETINAMVYSVAEPILALGRALYKLAHGDFKGAADEMMGWPDRVATRWGEAMDRMTESSRETAAKIGEIFNPDKSPSTKKPVSGDGSASTNEHAEKPKSRVAEWRAALVEQLEATKDYLADTTQVELTYWEGVKARNNLTKEERQQVNTVIFGLHKKLAADLRNLDLESIEARRKVEESRISLERETISAERDLGTISNAEAERRFVALKAEEYRIEREALTARLQLVQNDARERMRIEAELTALEAKRKVQQLKDETAHTVALRKTWEAAFKPAGDAIANLTGQMMQRMGLVRSGMQGIWGSIVNHALQSMGTIAARWLALQALKLASGNETLTKIAALLGLETATAGVAKKAEAAAVIPAEAAMAAGGAAASVASIPYVGPAMAAEAYAATMKMVLSGLAVASASKGWDIPAGLNPMTQLHEREMVLPAEHADTIRALGKGDGAGGAVHIHGQGGDWINKRQLADLLRKMGRDFVFVA